jgi:glycosyltransferase involved in cell wall biosynthesis
MVFGYALSKNKFMKILHIVSGIDDLSGGPSVSIPILINGLQKKGIEARILTTVLKKQVSGIVQNDFVDYSFRISLSKRFAYSYSFLSLLKKYPADIIHVHGFWQFPQHISCRYARRNKVPYIITPHGMISPIALSYSKWIKKIALFLYQKKDLKNASVIHVTGNQEINYVRLLGLSNPVAVIPNAIEVKDKITKARTEKKRLAFIGRFHEIKNIESLIRAWATIKNTHDWELVLVGDGEANYVQSLKRLVSGLQLQNVVFTGFLVGDEKEKIMQTLDVVVLPSFSENFGMVVGEALQNEIPVIASTGTPWDDLQTHQCGWWVNNDVETLTQTIQQSISLSDEERQQMGQRGRQLIIEKYSVEIVATQMIRLYEWVLKGGEKPEFVYE